MIDNYYYNNKIIFPNTLDLTKDMDYDKEKKQKFNLIGIINHLGKQDFIQHIVKIFMMSFGMNLMNQFVDEIKEFSNISKNVMLLFYKRIEL